MAFLKQASLKIENPEISVDSWIGNKSHLKTAKNKLVEYKKIVADFSPDNYLLTHCTIVASVNVEEAPTPVKFGSERAKAEFSKISGKKDYFITPETSKYINANGDAWSRDLLKSSYKTFIGAENYVEHVQDPTLSKGKILDAVLREVDGGNSLFVDILVATNKKHSDLVSKIKTGKLTTLSMGSVVAFTICTRCGNVAADETELCHHIKFLKRNSFISENDGKKRITAELCGHNLYPESNKFIEGSWVETPAFKGAVLRNEVDIADFDKEAFVEKYEPVMNIQSSDLRDTASRIFAAFSLVDKIRQATKISKTEDETDVLPETDPEEYKSEEVKDPIRPEDSDLPEPPSDKDLETEEEAPKEEPKDTVDVPKEEESKEETKEEAPVEEVPEETKEPADVSKDEVSSEPEVPETETPEELPQELEEKGESPVEEAPPIEKQPFDVVKEDIKKNLKEQIKKELLQDLGIDFTTPTQTLNQVNLNDTLVKSNLNYLKKASKIYQETGLKGLIKKGYSKEEVLKIAFMTNRYSINKSIFESVNELDFYKFSTFRRYSKEIEKKIGRELTLTERQHLDRLLVDLYL